MISAVCVPSKIIVLARRRDSRPHGRAGLVSLTAAPLPLELQRGASPPDPAAAGW